MSDTMPASALRPGHIVETPDLMRFAVARVEHHPSGREVGIVWTDGMVETYNPDTTFDVVGETTEGGDL